MRSSSNALDRCDDGLPRGIHRYVECMEADPKHEVRANYSIEGYRCETNWRSWFRWYQTCNGQYASLVHRRSSALNARQLYWWQGLGDGDEDRWAILGLRHDLCYARYASSIAAAWLWQANLHVPLLDEFQIALWPGAQSVSKKKGD